MKCLKEFIENHDFVTLVRASKAGRIYIDVQLSVPFSHCKSQLGFDWSPALQC